jgi:four helix bundle protein
LDLSRFNLIEQTCEFSNSIWEEVILWRIFERDTIGKQLVRSADSISANLSEAHGRYSYADRKRFAYFARGSLCETITWLNLSIARGIMEKEKGETLQSNLQLISRQINTYIHHLK